jgi:CRP-like cAMP-binding protein
VPKDKELLETIRALPLFSHCTDDELRHIDQMADEVHVPAGRHLIRQGELGREFVVIEEGTAKVERNDVEIATLGPGQWFGELALLDDHIRNATVTAVTDVVVQVIDRRAFQTLLEDTPGLALSLLRGTARRLSELDREISELRSQPSS